MIAVSTLTKNVTNGKTYESTVVKWSPQASFSYDMSENANIRFFYFGSSQQPSTSQLMPVPDNTDPVNISLGNPYLNPYFSHRLRGMFRYSNKKNFISVNGFFGGNFVQDAITSATWYDDNSVKYNIPVNTKGTGNLDARVMANIPMPVKMFLYFGYVDEELAGLNNAVTLYRLAENMTDHSTVGVYTFYDWLMAIFRGQKSPSRNEFDQDYSDYIHKQKVGGNITDAELKALENNPMAKVNYELRNMFPQVNKITFGRITTFCPLFCADDVLKDLESSYVTVSRVAQILEEIRRVDYTAFYRESLDMEHIDVMGKETIHLEYLPDIILMPNVGIRGVMWQEIEGKRRNSPGRMVFSIFHLEDLKTTFTHLTGEFRWELCKRVQGNRWNDVSTNSLTSEYFDYIQFYRKNHDLSAEAKEKVKSSLQRAKNSFKEMFVRDYMIWVLFEGAGSPRLNKVARQIMFTYCPFPEDICNTLAQNPLYSDLLDRRKIKVAQGLHHLDVLTRKLQNGNILVPETVVQERYYISGSKKA